MQKLVFLSVATDECTYSFDLFDTFWYQSKEKAEEDFFTVTYSTLEKHLAGQLGTTEIHFFRSHTCVLWNYWSQTAGKCSLSKNIKDYTYLPPTILTLDEWFERQIVHM